MVRQLLLRQQLLRHLNHLKMLQVFGIIHALMDAQVAVDQLQLVEHVVIC
jgi:hypothetical protein